MQPSAPNERDRMKNSCMKKRLLRLTFPKKIPRMSYLEIKPLLYISRSIIPKPPSYQCKMKVCQATWACVSWVPSKPFHKLLHTRHRRWVVTLGCNNQRLSSGHQNVVHHKSCACKRKMTSSPMVELLIDRVKNRCKLLLKTYIKANMKSQISASCNHVKSSAAPWVHHAYVSIRITKTYSNWHASQWLCKTNLPSHEYNPMQPYKTQWEARYHPHTLNQLTHPHLLEAMVRGGLCT